MARTHDEVVATNAPTNASLLRWSSVLGGVVIGGALLILLTTLWTALAVATEVEAVADGIGWYLAASAIVALFVGGLLAGALSGVPGIGPGTFNGLAVWGVILLLSAAVGVPGALNAFATPGIDLPGLEGLEAGQAIWPAFWSLLIGAVTAGLGGALGGMMTRGAPMAVRQDAGAGHVERTVVDRRDDDRGGYEERGRYAEGDRGRDYDDDRDDRDRDDDERVRAERGRGPRHVAGGQASGAPGRGPEPGGSRPASRADRDYPPAP